MKAIFNKNYTLLFIFSIIFLVFSIISLVFLIDKDSQIWIISFIFAIISTTVSLIIFYKEEKINISQEKFKNELTNVTNDTKEILKKLQSDFKLAEKNIKKILKDSYETVSKENKIWNELIDKNDTKQKLMDKK